MELKVLGRYGPYTTERDTSCSCYLLTDGDLRLLLDMGPGSLGRVIEYADPGTLSAVWISHLHFDHTADLLPLRYYLENKPGRLKIIVEPQDTDYYRLLTGDRCFEVIEARPGEKLTLDGAELEFSRMKHPFPDLALTVRGSKTFVYTGDTSYFEGIERVFDGADAVLADCSKPAGYDGPHMDCVTAKKLAALTGVRILATHLTPGSDPTADFADCPSIEVVAEMETYVI